MSDENVLISDNETEEQDLGKAYDAKLMKRLLKYAKEYWVFFVMATILLLASTVTDIARPYLMKVAIDSHIAKGDFKGLGQVGMIFLALIVGGFIFNLLQTYILSYTGQTIIYNIRQQVFSHLQKMGLAFFDKNPIGRLVTRVTNDTEALNDMYTNVLVSLLKDFFLLGGTVVVMFKMNVNLTLISLSILPIVIILTMIFRKVIRLVYRDVRLALAHINSVLSENISGMRIIQIFNREQEKFDQFKETNNEYLKAGMRELLAFGLFRPAIEMLSYISIALIIWYGGGQVVRENIEFGVLFAFINYVSLFFQPINDLAEKYNILQSAMASSERIFLILDTPVEEDFGTKILDKAKIKGEIEFRHVWFAYKEENWVLRDVSFKVLPGETLAIVGATGAGKTSIINLLNRFYEIQKGDIFIDGVNIKELTKDSLRAAVGVVLQDVFLFTGNIRDNIRLNDISITNEEIERVSDYVNAHGFINKYAAGYDEEVKERGATFSSGQRQLLAFARALAFDPSILVLDEATSSIDTETELLIQDALEKITSSRTTIVIAHRLSTIQHADNILVLHKGKIRETGTHQQLLSQKSMYYNLYQLQIKQGDSQTVKQGDRNLV